MLTGEIRSQIDRIWDAFWSGPFFGHITDDGLALTDLVYVPRTRVSSAQRIHANDLLVATSSGSLDVVGKAAGATPYFDGGLGAFCKVLRPKANVDGAYSVTWTPHYRVRVAALAAGANINNLRNEIALDSLFSSLQHQAFRGEL